MSDYYNASRGASWNYGGKNWKLSRSKIDLFLNCPRCFYLDNKLGVGRPKGFPFNLNSAVDALLKKEFDIHRAKNTTHPLMKAYGLDLVPFQHKMMNEWRENFKGVQFLHQPTKMLISGAIDDLWTDAKGVIYVVDYKATSKDAEVTLDADWQIGYKRQMEIYQWLLRRNDFTVSDTGYFVYCNGRTDREAFDAKLEFDVKIIPYTGDDSWVEQAIINAHQCLTSNQIPAPATACDYCNYLQAITAVTKSPK
jgi:hypothetical protein